MFICNKKFNYNLFAINYFVSPFNPHTHTKSRINTTKRLKSQIYQITGHAIRIPNSDRANLTMSFWLFCGFIQKQ